MSAKKNILLLYGGKSVEHEISIRSARNVFDNIDKGSYEVVLVGIDKEGVWRLNGEVSSSLSDGEKVSPVPSAGQPMLISLENHRLIPFDIAFPVLHGTDGEDGGVQGIFKAYNVPLVGCNVLGSAVSMDKILSKKVLKASGVPVADFLYFSRNEADRFDYRAVVAALGSPFMIKAGALGSSVGISKVNNEPQYREALDEAFRYGSQVLIEKYVKGRELECGVMGNENPVATYPGEIVLKKDYEFYTYQAKYQDDDAIDIVIPARVDDAIAGQIRDYCVKAYTALCCNDYARVDLFLSENNEVIINEINTIPGFTSVSMFPMLWKNMGVSYPDLISKLIELAETRWKKQNEYLTHYDKA